MNGFIEKMDNDDQGKFAGGDDTGVFSVAFTHRSLKKLTDLLKNGDQALAEQYNRVIEEALGDDLQDLLLLMNASREDSLKLINRNREILIQNLIDNTKRLQECTAAMDNNSNYEDYDLDKYDMIRSALDRNAYVCASTKGRTDKDMDEGGITNNHAYTVLDAFKDEKTGIRYVVVRNPHGGAGTVYHQEENGQTSMHVSEEESYGVNQVELKHFLNTFNTIYYNG